ncbi:hypothetical protein H2203_005189 [Taxawa tesnikishii (nom. ined.)]|nr:hypothetical protein H2203_005157 [Dothideales sp. JES 119]KAJ9624454.1 hypothetical protein H2203_005189 [Dothideales sp. JES 119]
MSKAIRDSLAKIKATKSAPSKFTPAAREGSRIFPSKDKDAEYQVRIDAGKYDDKTKKLNVVLQVNSQAKSPGLKDFVKRNTTHGKLATAQFDTEAADKQKEMERVLAELEQGAKEKLR